MTKELVVSASSHDTKIAILEDGQLVEVFFEREKEYSLAGSIYKGRVTRILPGMQSAFVNIGLERDAFLYVSDFLEQVEEYERVATAPPDRGSSRERTRGAAPEPAGPLAAEVSSPSSPPITPPSAAGPVRSMEPPAPRRAEPLAEPVEPSARPEGPSQASAGRADAGDAQPGKSRRFSRRSRGHRGRNRELPDSKYARQNAPPPQAQPREVREPREPRRETEEPPPQRIILPGESLAKYKGGPVPAIQSALETPRPTAEAAAVAEQISETVIPLDILETPAAIPTAFEVAIEAIRHADREAVAAAEAEPEAAAAQGFLPVEEAVEAAREEKMIEELEDEAVEIAETEAAGPAPLGGAPESRESWDAWEEPEPGGEAAAIAAAAAYFEGEPEPPAMASGLEADSMISENPESSAPEAAGAPREAAVRERSGNPRFQRRPRWGGPRRAPRGDDPRRRPPRSGEREREAPRPLIGDMLKEGQEILVQIAKEPLGKKGARITSHIALPGRYIVYMPTLDHTGVSRKIESDEERHRLKRIIVEQTRGRSGGFIVRTAGEGHSEEDLRQDVLFLVNLWAEVKAKAEKAAAPALLHHDLDLTLRTLRDQLSDEFQTIWVDNEAAFEEIVRLVQKFQPALVNRVRLFTKDVPLFEETGVQEEINKALKPKVWMKSGGYIVINQTEALVAIDVNTGKFVGKSNRLEDTIVKTNVEAIQEIVRQIRLRDLGGIIVIDFIDMDERRNRQKVMTELEDALKHDKAPSKILAFNEFGLIAITRKRVRQSLERTLCQPCSYCSGAGLVKTPATVCLEILSEAKKMAAELEGKHVTLRVNPEVGKALKSRDSAVLAALEEITGRGVIIRSDAAVHIENFYFD